MARPKAVRHLEPNLGTAIAAGKKIQAIVNAFEKAYKREALKIAAKYVDNTMVHDAVPGTIPSGLEVALATLAARSELKQGAHIKEVSRWFCRRLLREVTPSQRRALQRAGFSPAWLKQKWTVPVLRGQYVAPSVASKLPEQIEHNAALITKLCRASAHKVQNAIADGISKGYDLSKLTERINGLENMDEARAARVALDQSCKLNQFVQVENAKSLGVKEGIWVHVPGQFESRLSHMKMNGKKFDLDKGMYDEEVQDYIHPGELPYCRCCFKAILPGFLLD